MKYNSILAFLLLVSSTLFSQIPKLTRDINNGYVSSNPSNYYAAGNVLYFSASGSTKLGAELWKTDGTPQGTVMVKDINPGTASSSPANFCKVGNSVFFSATNALNGLELWKTDGTDSGTVMVKDIATGTENSYPTYLINYKGTLLFSATTTSNGSELWKSDGSDSGTVLLKDIRSGATGASISNMILFGDSVYFSANDGTNGSELWSTNGLGTGTQMLKNLYPGSNSGSPGNFTLFKNKLYFTAYDSAMGRELWVTDGTALGTYVYQDFMKGTAGSSPTYLTVSNGSLFFSAATSLGNELCKTIGTDSIKTIDINQFGSSYPQDLINVGGKLFFTASVDNGRELYVSDGTSSGTYMTRDLYPIQTDAYISNLTVIDSTLFFTAHESPYYQDYELYSSSAKSPYPSRIKDICPGTTSSNPSYLTPFNGKLYFSANNQVNGNEMWVATTTKTANLFLDIDASTLNANISAICALNNGVVFNATTPLYGDEVWTSKGDSTSTIQIRDIESGTASSQPRNFYSFGGKALFNTTAGSSGYFYSTDGTNTNYLSITGGTQSISEYTPYNNKLYLVRTGSSIAAQLYAFDGSTYASLVRALNPNNLGDYVANLTVFKNKLYFSGSDGNTSGNELFVTDGTYGGTTIFKDIRSGISSSNPQNLEAVDSMLFFSADNGTKGSELWVSDGTTSNTLMVKDINNGVAGSGIANMTKFGSKAVFTATNSTFGKELWISNGTDTGTNVLLDIVAGTGSSNPHDLMVVNNLLYFIANDNIHGDELWVSDGTALGTKMVKDINLGATNANCKNLTKVRNYLYFSANDGVNGQELWRTDGTEANTKMLFELQPGIMSSNPELLTLVGDTLYFTADHPNYGNELFYLYTNCMIAGLQGKSTCIGDTISFTDQTQALGSTKSNFLWDFGNGKSSTIQNPKYAYDSSGTYKVTLLVTNSDGCSVSSSQTFTIAPKPVSNFTIDNDTVCLKGNAVKFTNLSTPTSGPFSWAFGDNTTSTSVSPTYTYKTAGTFTIALTVGSTPACKITSTMSLLILPTPVIASINGKTTAHVNNTDTFNVNSNAGSSYVWTVTGGVIKSGNGTNQIIVTWNAVGTLGTVQVIETNSFGCESDAKKINVSLNNTGISEVLKQHAISITPNPTNGVLHLNSSAVLDNQTSIKVINLLGQTVYEMKGTNQSNYTIDLSGNFVGIYFVEVKTTSNSTITKIILTE